MSSRGGTGIRAAHHPVVVLAGEDRNDRRSLRILLEEMCPSMQGRIVEINDTVRLRAATGANLSDRVATLAKKVRARALREGANVSCVFVHEDLDAVDGRDYDAVHARVQRALLSSFTSAHYVLSVWEIEAWLLLFPDAVEGLIQSWSVPARYRNRDTGGLTDPKRIMKRECSQPRRPYRESDAPEIFAKAVELRCLDGPVGKNRSWARFRSDADECCRAHVPRQR